MIASDLTPIEVFAVVIAANVHTALFGLVIYHAPRIWAVEKRGGRFMLALGLAFMATPVYVAYQAMA